TAENRPLIGPLPVAGAYVVGALSGYGLMAAPAAGELLAAHLARSTLPDYSSASLLSRYRDPAYQALLAAWGDPGSRWAGGRSVGLCPALGWSLALRPHRTDWQ